MSAVRILEAVCCFLLVLAGLGFSFLALVLTGGDSAFANESRWVYAPFLLSLALTAGATGATALGYQTASAALIAASCLAYAATWVYWDAFG